METGEIIQIFAQSGFQVDPQALDAMRTSSPEQIQHVVGTIDSSVLVVGIEHLKPNISIFKNLPVQVSPPEIQRTPIEIPKKSAPVESSVTILKDITNQSTCIGEYTEFVQYFRDRYDSLYEIFGNRLGARPIASLKKMNLDSRGEFSIIGMVFDIRTSPKGHKIIDIEDKTGMIRVLIHKEQEKELFEAGCRILLDEVIGITGTLFSDGNMIFAKKISWPDISNSRNGNLNGKKGGGKAVFISDIHVGSKTFLEDSWLKFIDWLDDDINYLVIAGDVVDGIGIFPGQDKELAISDIYEQYEKAAQYLNAVPKHIKIIISPGNHDAVRQAEPQPRFPERITKMFRKDIIFVGNPAMVDIGVKVLIYHGRSMDDIIASIPGFSYNEPAKPMHEMLKLRHLSPIYGGRVSIAPEKKDHFVIDEIPDILHCGHVHTVGVSRYRDVLAINSGTWQSQTEFQKRMNLQPMPARATVVDLSGMEYKIMDFN
jgi:DNA polymerase II small subunit